MIDDSRAQTIVASSTLDKDLKAQIEKTATKEASLLVGKKVAEKALEKNVTTIVFDRGNRPYHGRIQSVAEGARDIGLIFKKYMENTENKTNSSEQIKKSGNKDFKGKRKPIIRLSKVKYEEKIVQIKRVTKVVKGGKKMTFRAVVIIGDNKRKVGVGIGRADDINLAIDKAIINGKKNLINVPLTLKDSIPHVVKGSYGACKLMLRPAQVGTGVIAGGSVRTVLELAELKIL